MSEQLNFEQMIEESMKNINVKETIEGTIININKKGEVIIDIGYKADGIIPRDEYSYNESADPSEELKIGDKITAEVIKMNYRNYRQRIYNFKRRIQYIYSNFFIWNNKKRKHKRLQR